jgi:YD repeat-containing protein
MAGSADTRTCSGSATNTQYRDASGRLTGSQTTNTSPSGSFTGTQRDAAGRLTGGSTGSGEMPRHRGGSDFAAWSH